VKVILRDFWNKEDGTLQQNLALLQKLLDCSITIEPNWERLLVDLAKYYADNGELAMAVSTCVDAWLRSLVELLDTNSYPALSEALNGRSGLQVFPEVCISRYFW
jgi:hypothetical protein